MTGGKRVSDGAAWYFALNRRQGSEKMVKSLLFKH